MVTSYLIYNPNLLNWRDYILLLVSFRLKIYKVALNFATEGVAGLGNI
jgi:hypothetical protein